MQTDAEVASTYPVMRQLRPHLDEGEYPRTVRRMRGEGYRLAAVVDGGRVGAVAGFRVVEFLMWGRLLYVDDLVTAEGARSKGYGKMMLDWLAERAREEGCGSLQLDSGVQRGDAHRFYFRERMRISSYHFSKEV
jgi:GNAT superfamily N-acetyltransferase